MRRRSICNGEGKENSENVSPLSLMLLRPLSLWHLLTAFLIVVICPCSSLFSFVVTLAATTGLLTPHALPKAVLDGTKT